jgi:hypothetical protein
MRMGGLFILPSDSQATSIGLHFEEEGKMVVTNALDGFYLSITLLITGI